MKTFIIPVAYFISDDNDLTLHTYKVEAENRKYAQLKVINRIKQEERDNYGSDNMTPDEIEDMIPSIWIQGEESEEEGYIIAPEKEIIELDLSDKNLQHLADWAADMVTDYIDEPEGPYWVDLEKKLRELHKNL